MWKMQRLYGTFPSRGAGVALLLLRFTIAGALLAQARVCLPPGTDLIVAIYVLAACLLVAGLFTPIVAVATAALSVGTIMLCRELAVSGLMIAILVALALLGAGSYSSRREVIWKTQACLFELPAKPMPYCTTLMFDRHAAGHAAALF